jgi:outer membrane lipoprotein LolB
VCCKLPVFSALLVLLLAACAGQQTEHPGERSWTEHSARLRALANWSAEGKLALRTPEQSESASLNWRQRGVITRLQLSGPLGMAATTLYSNGQTLEIRQGEDLSSWDLTDRTALESKTGWDLPLLALPHWIKGLPAPDMAIQGMLMGPDPALLEMLEQDDWRIHYEAYADFDTLTLPTRLRLEHSDTTLRLIIRDWTVSSD